MEITLEATFKTKGVILARDDQYELIIGSQAPDFELQANTGQVIRLEDFRGSKQVLLFFIREFE